MYPFHIPTKDSASFFLHPCIKVNPHYERTNTLEGASVQIIGPFKDQNDRFPYPFKYFNPRNPFIYLKRETLSVSEMPVL